MLTDEYIRSQNRTYKGRGQIDCIIHLCFASSLRGAVQNSPPVQFVCTKVADHNSAGNNIGMLRDLCGVSLHDNGQVCAMGWNVCAAPPHSLPAAVATHRTCRITP